MLRSPRGEIAQDQTGRHDADDRFMVAVAKLEFDLVLPRRKGAHRSYLHSARGGCSTPALRESSRPVSDAGSMASRLEGHAGQMAWQLEFATPGIAAIFPPDEDRHHAGERT